MVLIIPEKARHLGTIVAPLTLDPPHPLSDSRLRLIQAVEAHIQWTLDTNSDFWLRHLTRAQREAELRFLFRDPLIGELSPPSINIFTHAFDLGRGNYNQP